MKLGYESGDQVAAFDEKKNRSKKSRASVPLRHLFEIMHQRRMWIRIYPHFQFPRFHKFFQIITTLWVAVLSKGNIPDFFIPDFFTPGSIIVRYHCGGWPEEVNSCVLNSYMVYL